LDRKGKWIGKEKKRREKSIDIYVELERRGEKINRYLYRVGEIIAYNKKVT
jgi:hypothetical protein